MLNEAKMLNDEAGAIITSRGQNFGQSGVYDTLFHLW